MTMDELTRQARDHPTNYPSNLLETPEFTHRLEALQTLLQDRKRTLFSRTGQVCVLERIGYQQNGGSKILLSSEDEVRHHFGLTGTLFKMDPQTRFM